MNLRILKKLSKRAAPYLPLIGDTREQFPAETGDNYTKTLIWDRTCWERSYSAHGDRIREGEIKWLARNTSRRFPWCYMAPPHHPLKGTVMVGSMCGYYQPEWDEETAWESFRDWVWWQFAKYSNDGSVHCARVFEYPGDFFRAADELLAAKTDVQLKSEVQRSDTATAESKSACLTQNLFAAQKGDV